MPGLVRLPSHCPDPNSIERLSAKREARLREAAARIVTDECLTPASKQTIRDATRWRRR